MPHLAIIADDLTGANDTGVQFAKCGLRTHVVIDADSNLPTAADVVVVDTDSRGLIAELAYQRVSEAARKLKDSHIPIIYKKVDSTLRGNLGAEIDAILDVFEFDCAIVAPAFPQIGRITIGGYHLLNNVPLQCTEIARDPISPVTESRLAAILRSQSRYGVSHVELVDVLSGQERMRQCVDACCCAGDRLIGFDATDETHLEAIAKAAFQSGRRILWVGSAGMAEFLPTIYSLPVGEGQLLPNSRGLPVLVVAGSVSNVTALQVQAFLANPDSALVVADGQRLIEQESDEILRCVDAARGFLRRGLNTALVSPCDRESVIAACASGVKLGLSPAAVSERIARSLGSVAKQLADEVIEGVFLTGGDTAVKVCHALGASSMEICSEVAAGIPFAQVSAGPYNGLKVVTKAGAFGDEQAINKAVAVMQNK